jgi:hypothetical protein
MMMVTLVAGIGLVVAGLLAIGYGVQYKEFSFGSTLIQSGVVGACAGMILIGVWMAVRELKAVAQRLTGASPAHPRPELSPAVAAPRGPATPADSGFLFTRDQSAIGSPAGDEPVAPAASAPPPWHEEVASRARSEAPQVAPPAPAEVAPKRRNLLFSSSRRERERAQTRTSEALTPDLLTPELRPNPPAAQPALEPSEPQPATFKAAWPRADRPRPAELPRRSPRIPSTLSEGEDAPTPGSAPERHPPAPREEQPPVTVLKSGVVDGMAYSLYSDGSIEAQMPEGMMRFASIDELRSHLDQRS